MGNIKKNKEITKKGNFVCSVCQFTASLIKETEKHIIDKHYGVARINDPNNTPFDDKELIKVYIKVQKTLKILKCFKCSKTFRSGLGYKMHVDTCGKEDKDLKKECEVCGKIMKINMLKIHIKNLHMDNDNASNEFLSVEELIRSKFSKETVILNDKKRTSAVKALGKFQELSDEDIVFVITPQDDNDIESEETDMEISDEAESCDEIEDNPNNKTNNGDIHLNITPKMLDKMLISIKNYLKRDFTEPTPDQTVDENFIDLEGDKSEDVSNKRYKCYNERCKKTFNYRLDLENHYKICSNQQMVFICSVFSNETASCFFSSKFIELEVFRHFFIEHPSLIPFDTKFANVFKDVKFDDNRHSIKRKTFKSNAENERFQDDNSNYSEDIIKFLIGNSRPLTFCCLKARKSHLKKLTLNYTNNPSSIIPRFKLIKSIEAGDNEFKFVPPSSSLKGPGNTFMFNVGQFVTAAAWAPHPLETSENLSAKLNFTNLLKESCKRMRTQYLAISTISYEREILDINKGSDEHSYGTLQLWDMGLMEMGNSDNVPPKLALNVVHNYGDVKEMVWCPCGSTWEDVPNLDHFQTITDGVLPRIGLLAICNSFGEIRVFAIPHPTLLGEFNSYNTLEPILILEPRYVYLKNFPCNTLDWSRKWPQNTILGGFGNGLICLWSLNEYAKCSQSPCHDHQDTPIRLRPLKVFQNPKYNTILSIRWMNDFMFFTSSTDTCRLWHSEHHPNHYGEFDRNIVEKIEVYPLWYNSVLLMDTTLNRPNNLIVIKSFSDEEFYDPSFNMETNRVHTVANASKIRLNDMSVSPWMYIVSYCTENGELFASQLLPKPLKYRKKSFSQRLYQIRLGDFDLALNTKESMEEMHSSCTNTKQIKGKKSNMAKPKKECKNVFLNGCTDVAYCTKSDFYLKYFLFFEDMNVRWNGKITKGDEPMTTYLTKNDINRYYSITNCAWNPNISSYSWLFSATKSGLCRLGNYPLVNPTTVH
ncbi:General transcription factor 3C polypeptide 2 [Blomia tropicalis]|nr:General transcription factor 3C polypeptide 2 [Blomia tropicalis]